MNNLLLPSLLTKLRSCKDYSCTGGKAAHFSGWHNTFPGQNGLFWVAFVSTKDAGGLTLFAPSWGNLQLLQTWTLVSTLICHALSVTWIPNTTLKRNVKFCRTTDQMHFYYVLLCQCCKKQVSRQKSKKKKGPDIFACF